ARAAPHPQRLIHTSTSDVSGTALRVPIDETHPLQGQPPSSASKIGADKLVEAFYNSYDLPVVTVRPFNTYGPRQSARAVIPTIIAQALTQPALRLGALDTRRDLTYVSDTVAGFLAAAAAPGVEGQTFNLGTGSEVTVAEIVRQVLALTGRDLPVQLDPQRVRPPKSEVLRLLSDNTKARTLLGWSPEIPLPAGLRLTLDFISSHLSLYHPDRYEI
ncbi:MAG: GDP-mannose 4,6-dehydratase, partial [Anaerolineaceae bacterium]|nr:GDP-mannose 4,6-dehydratase [Anaerolineaceae bacterium]